MQNLKSASATKLVNSPHAKYDSRGQLRCIVCGCPVKSAIVWQAHVAKKSHIQNLKNLELKQKQLNCGIQGVKRKGSSSNTNLAPPLKKAAAISVVATPVVTAPVVATPVVKPKGILKGVTSYSSSDSEEEVVNKPELSQNGLPANFFDSNQNTSNATTTGIKSEEPEDPYIAKEEPMSVDDPNDPQQYYISKEEKVKRPPSPLKVNSAEGLPEGFFDDPVQDAKVRKVEYVNKDEAEWNSFMREVSAAETTSRQIIDEDAEEAAMKNMIREVDEQIQLNKKVIQLDEVLKTRRTPAAPQPATSQEDSDDSSLSDDNEDSFLSSNFSNWRSRTGSL